MSGTIKKQVPFILAKNTAYVIEDALRFGDYQGDLTQSWVARSLKEKYGNISQMWADNNPTHLKLKIAYPGEKSWTVEDVNIPDRRFNVFPTEFLDILQNLDISKGVFEGDFIWIVKGQRYGLKRVE